MMNGKVVAAVFIVTGSGVVNAFTTAKPVTPVIIGSYVFLLILAVMDAFGGPMTTLAGALAMIAATFVLLTEFPWQQLIKLVQGNKQAAGGG